MHRPHNFIYRNFSTKENIKGKKKKRRLSLDPLPSLRCKHVYTTMIRTNYFFFTAKYTILKRKKRRTE